MMIPNERQVCSQDNDATSEKIILLTHTLKETNKHIKSSLEGGDTVCH